MSQRQAPRQKGPRGSPHWRAPYLDYADRNGTHWEYTPAFDKWQRQLSLEQYQRCEGAAPLVSGVGLLRVKQAAKLPVCEGFHFGKDYQPGYVT